MTWYSTGPFLPLTLPMSKVGRHDRSVYVSLIWQHGQTPGQVALPKL